MAVDRYVSDIESRGYHTETAATLIQEMIQGEDGRRIALTDLSYTAGATAHSLLFRYPGSAAGCRTTASAAAAAAQKVLNVTDAPVDPAGNPVASGDDIAYQLPDGSWEFNTVASLSTKAITLTNNIAVAVASGARVVVFGVAADLRYQKFAAAASVTTEWSNGGDMVAISPKINRGDPVILESNNATNDGFLNRAVFKYLQV